MIDVNITTLLGVEATLFNGTSLREASDLVTAFINPFVPEDDDQEEENGEGNE